MPSKINILSEFLMKRIAAGEVVERPASVAKELLENAIDAGASKISLMIKESGSRLIQVVDDGEGMTEEDALICCKRHATSKISTPADLETIHTLGFRGEALASISSVARLVIATCTENDQEGTELHLEGDSIKEVLKVAPKKGTSVSVKDLFYSVPARRKFLKRPTTELRHILGVFRRIALAYPQIHFSLFIDDEKTLDILQTDTVHRVRDLWGGKIASSLVPFQKEISDIKIQGYVSRPGDFQKSRENQLFFLNRRYIVSKSLVHSVLSAYGPRLAPNQYPTYLIFIEMDPRSVDVNVHPTKIEVRFHDDKYIHDVLKRAIQDGLRKPEAVPDLQLIPGKPKFSNSQPIHQARPEDFGQLTLEAQSPGEVIPFRPLSTRPRETHAFWQLHNRYILTQIKSGLTMFDQHVAHERILYEKALKAKGQHNQSQQLLFPQTIQLTPDDYLVLEEFVPFLEKIGFDLKEFGRYTIVIEAVPVEIKQGTEKDILSDMIAYYKDEKQETPDTWDAVAKSYACKAAIKSGDKLEHEEMASLINELFTCDEPYFCPHGRPVIVNLTLEEIDKRFGR